MKKTILYDIYTGENDLCHPCRHFCFVHIDDKVKPYCNLFKHTFRNKSSTVDEARKKIKQCKNCKVAANMAALLLALTKEVLQDE